jgi:hypothetical protein
MGRCVHVCLKVWGFKHHIPQRGHGNSTLQMGFVCIRIERIQFEYSIQIHVGIYNMPFLVYFIKNVGIWWAIRFRGGSFGVSILKIYEVQKNGLKNKKTYSTTIEKSLINAKQQK